MGLMDFIKKQFIDIIEWTEEGDGTLAWRFPMEDREIQNGGSLTVRESQMAMFVNEGRVADVFGPGRYTLTTATLPVLTYLQNWDKLFRSPFKSDVYFFSTRQQIDQRWGTSQPVTIRDKDFGAVRLRAFGNYSYRIADPRLFYNEISGTRERYTVEEVDGQLRGLMLQHISDAIAESGLPFLDLAANQVEFARALGNEMTPALAANAGMACAVWYCMNLAVSPTMPMPIRWSRIFCSSSGSEMFCIVTASRRRPSFSNDGAVASRNAVANSTWLAARSRKGMPLPATASEMCCSISPRSWPSRSTTV